MSDRIKYNAPLPGDEFRLRALTVPAEAAKVLFEIDFQYGQDRELCLSILANVFRGTDSVTKILQESKEIFRRGKVDGAPWRYEATIQRNLAKTLREQELGTEDRRCMALEKEFLRLKEKEKDILNKVRVRGVEGEGRERRDEEVIRGDLFVTPGFRPQNLGRHEGAYDDIQEAIKENRDALVQVKCEYARIAEELAVFRADPMNERFSEEEERVARAKLAEKGKEAEAGKAGDGEWREFLSKALVAILQAPSVSVARAKMDVLGSQIIETCPRDAKSLLEFAGDLDKACQFAIWQAKIFNTEPVRLSELVASLEQRAFATFQSRLK